MAGLVSIVLAGVQPVRAGEADAVLGLWQQVASNAGACPTCTVTFLPDGEGLRVSANNGWSARLRGRGPDADGAGRWPATGRNWVSGRPFTIGFHLEHDAESKDWSERLEMVMTVETATGGKRVVRGVYRRAWQGV